MPHLRERLSCAESVAREDRGGGVPPRRTQHGLLRHLDELFGPAETRKDPGQLVDRPAGSALCEVELDQLVEEGYGLLASPDLEKRACGERESRNHRLRILRPPSQLEAP